MYDTLEWILFRRVLQAIKVPLDIIYLAPFDQADINLDAGIDPERCEDPLSLV